MRLRWNQHLGSGGAKTTFVVCLGPWLAVGTAPRDAGALSVPPRWCVVVLRGAATEAKDTSMFFPQKSA